jgi:hypothetical protein
MEQKNDAANASTTTTTAADAELSQLLDDALQDFGANRRATAAANSDAELDELMSTMDRDAAQKAAKDFETMLTQLAELQKSIIEKQPSSSDAPLSSSSLVDGEQSTDQSQNLLYHINARRTRIESGERRQRTGLYRADETVRRR